MSELEISILSPAKNITKQSAESVTLPSLIGQICILPGHTKMVSELAVGELKIGRDSSNRFFISGGYVDVNDDKVVVMAEVIESPEDIDVVRAKKALDRANKRLSNPTGDVDLVRAMAALMRAKERLALAR